MDEHQKSMATYIVTDKNQLTLIEDNQVIAPREVSLLNTHLPSKKKIFELYLVITCSVSLILCPMISDNHDHNVCHVFIRLVLILSW